MQATLSRPPKRRLILLGGGHAHVQVLTALAMKSFPETEVVLISRDIHTPYSGMLPGYIAGHYTHDDIHIDLSKLARRANAQFIAESASGIDPEAQRITFPERPALHYDWLSINIGSTPNQRTPGAAEYALGVKPIDAFLKRLHSAIETLKSAPTALPIAVVGGGAAGVEVAMALRYRLQQERITTPIILVAGGGLLPGMPDKARLLMRAELERQQIKVRESRVESVHETLLYFADREALPVSLTIWTTGAVAKPWLADTGLQLTEHGFIAVEDTLQSVSHPRVFAAGDVATMVNQPRPKAGVFAVRQGQMLVNNLRRAVAGESLKTYSLQSSFLSLLALGDRRAIGVRRRWATSGKWVWWWKNTIDRRFMKKFQVRPMPIAHQDDPTAMRCTGCGGKVGGGVLRDALSLVPEVGGGQDVTSGIVLADAAISRQGEQRYLQSTDTFVDCIFDDYRLGQLIALHASNDVLSSGVFPDTALATVGIPPGSASLQADRLQQIQQGMQAVLSVWDCSIVGGHTLETDKPQVGLTVTAVVPGDTPLWSKSGAQPGDQICLTHPLGSGLLLAGYQSFRTEGRWLQAWLQTILASRHALMTTLQALSVTTVTDVSGFGLLGHLHEICQASQVGAALDYSSIPFLVGAESLAASGVQSSLLPSNKSYAPTDFAGFPDAELLTAENLLYDPQTAGGFLVILPKTKAERLVEADLANMIGQIEHRRDHHYYINIKHQL